ncbi:sensory neuron membrane protein 1-like [Leptopilina boulardi]|uniref:sensory neuron membrane protein 1-like n=1 Tax=Leptopilina boulardi TaxID=63433 RepID=UPI0021F5F17D|nr:sensory neuron membrane protein 1-like [Leptopilina boulardi]
MQLPMKLGIAGGVMFSLSVFFFMIAFPKILKSVIHKKSALYPGSEIRELWSDLPIPIDFKIYIFNITNAEEIEKGAYPNVKEVGPFFYDEWKKKVNLIDHEEDDTVEYNMKNWFVFNPSKSNGLTGEEEVVFPHLLILGMVMGTLREKPNAIGLVGKAINSIFHNPKSVFVKVKVKDLLFTGLPIDCTVTDFAGAAVCGILKEQGEDDLIKEGEGRYRFSFFGAKNYSTYKDSLRVYRGIKDPDTVGVVTHYGGKPAMDIWRGPECNKYEGTDSTIFHSYFYADEDLVSFAPDLCRSLGIKSVAKTKYEGIKTNRYVGGLGDTSSDPKLKCFCETDDTCLKQGLYDLTRCVGAPIVASLPHLYDTHEMYLKNVTGITPNKNEHELFVDFEPITGTPVSGRKRLQFNMFIQPVEKLKLMKNFPYSLLPLMWVEEGLSLEGDFLKQFKAVFRVFKIIAAIKWILFFGGLGLGGTAGYLQYKQRKANSMDVTKVTKSAGSKGSTTVSAMGGEGGEEKKQWPLNVQTLQSVNSPPNVER